MILYFSGMFLSDAGTLGAKDIVNRSSISSERLANTLSLIPTGQKRRGTYVLWSSIAFFHRAFSASSLPVDVEPLMTTRLSSWGSPESARTFDSRREMSR